MSSHKEITVQIGTQIHFLYSNITSFCQFNRDGGISALSNTTLSPMHVLRNFTIKKCREMFDQTELQKGAFSLAHQ